MLSDGQTHQSLRSALTGLSRVALRAGSKDAASDTSTRFQQEILEIEARSSGDATLLEWRRKQTMNGGGR